MNHIFFSYYLDGKGGATLSSDKQIISSEQKIKWVHLNAKNSATKGWLSNELEGLDPLIIDALLAEETRPRFSQINDGVLIILRGMNPDKNATPEDMISVRLWIEKNKIISTRMRSLNIFDEIKESFNESKGPKNSADFITILIEKLSLKMEPILTDLDERLVDVEEQILTNLDMTSRESIIDIRRQAIIFRRYIIPQRDAIEQLRLSNISWLNSSAKLHLAEVYNHIVRYIEDLDEARERSQVVKDELSNSLADKLNQKMYFLSIIAAIFLPLSFLTGLLGINVAGIPGADTPYAFWVFIAILISVVVFQIYLFKRLKWL